jgi:hypothetical protein
VVIAALIFVNYETTKINAAVVSTFMSRPLPF